mgnify:CR=1 FL=1
MSFDRAFQITVGVEGGYVNDPADPGGETKFGISHRSYPDIGIKALTLDQAKDIYRRDYWQAASCDSMPERIGHLVFDCAVHHGVKTAIKLLQRALKVADDGEFGPITRGTLTARDTNETADLLMTHRLFFMASCPAYSTYRVGWVKRCFRVSRES